MLQDAIKRGTGRGALVLQRSDLAGKTGTTNDYKDGWFSGYNSDIVTTTWIGFDNNLTLGGYASTSTLPTWIDFMRIALKNKPEHTLPQPADIITVDIDPKTGLLAREGQRNAEVEFFRADEVPDRVAPAPGVSQDTQDSQGNPTSPETLF
jgi:penicillin-binding protein 1A